MRRDRVEGEMPLSVRLRMDQRRWLEREAERRDRSIGWLVRDLINRAMGKAVTKE